MFHCVGVRSVPPVHSNLEGFIVNSAYIMFTFNLQSLLMLKQREQTCTKMSVVHDCSTTERNGFGPYPFDHNASHLLTVS